MKNPASAMNADLTSSLHAPRRLAERLAQKGLFACAVITVSAILGGALLLLAKGVAFFWQASWMRLASDTQGPSLFASSQRFGMGPLLAGTAMTAFIALAVALPLGLLAATYLSELASARTQGRLRKALEVVASVPAVVYGYFALGLITPALQRVVPGLSAFNALSAGLAMGIMVLPTLALLAESALSAVPLSLREGAWALGASRLQTVAKVVLPAASPRVVAAAILGLSRAVGETMVVAIAAGLQPQWTIDPRAPVETLTSYIVQVSQGGAPPGAMGPQSLWGVALALFFATLALNMAAERLRRVIPRESRGGRERAAEMRGS